MADLPTLAPGDRDPARHNTVTRQAVQRILEVQETANAAAPATRQIISGVGLTGGGDLSADRTLALANMAANTIKGRVTASTGAPEDLTADQAATVLRSGTGTQSVLQSKVITFQRNLATASGGVAYTGVGFKPSCLIAFAHVNTTATFTVSMVGADKVAGSIDYYGNNLTTNSAAFLQIQLADGSAGKYQVCDVASFDADGFTLGWVKVGLPTGTADIYVLCLR